MHEICIFGWFINNNNNVLLAFFLTPEVGTRYPEVTALRDCVRSCKSETARTEEVKGVIPSLVSTESDVTMMLEL